MNVGAIHNKKETPTEVSAIFTPEEYLKIEAMMDYKESSVVEVLRDCLESRYKSLFLIGVFDEISDPDTKEIVGIGVRKLGTG